MALIDNLKRAASKPPVPDDIQAEIAVAETALAAFEADRGQAALDVYLNADGADGRLAALNAKVEVSQKHLADLRLIHRAALARKDEDDRKSRRDGLKHAYSRVSAHLKARDEAASDFAKAAEALSAAYAKIHTANDAAREAWGIVRQEYPIEAFNDLNIERLCAGELWRNTPTTKKGEVIPGLALPAAQFPAIEYQHWPAGVPGLRQAFEANSVTIKAICAKRVPE